MNSVRPYGFNGNVLILMANRKIMSNSEQNFTNGFPSGDSSAQGSIGRPGQGAANPGSAGRTFQISAVGITAGGAGGVRVTTPWAEGRTDEVAVLRADAARLRAEVEALRVDAERYRWWRENTWAFSKSHSAWDSPDHMDDAIDLGIALTRKEANP